MLTAAIFYILLTLVWAIVGLWVFALGWTRKTVLMQIPLSYRELSMNSQSAKVSVLLPARNEENRVLRECIGSLLAQNFENLEIIAINDRSIDRTGEILREFADQNAKLIVIEGAEPPAGWLGKPFALQQALARATGEWILTIDADVVFERDAIATALVYAQEKNLDALCLIPFVVCQSFWEIVFIPIFNWFRLLAAPPQRVNDPAYPDAMGIGNFFLIRRSALSKINDFTIVQNDVAEDLRLAEVLKQSGALIKTEYAPDLIYTRMYSSFSEIWQGFTKNLFAGSKFSIKNAFLGAGSIFLYGVLPNLAMIFCAVAWLTTFNHSFLIFLIPLAFIYLLQCSLVAFLNRTWKLPIIYSVFAPVGLALFGAILINSTIKIVSGNGVDWKGRTIYQNKRNVQPATVNRR